MNFNENDKLQADYEKFLVGSFTLTETEVHQLGFKIASELGHSKIYAVDWNESVNGIGLGNVFEWTQEHDINTYNELMTEFQRIMNDDSENFKNKSVRELLLSFNDPKHIKEMHKYYLDMGTIGTINNPIGANWVAQYWYFRNLIIYSNLTKLIDSNEEKILVIYGRGHLYLLHHYVSEGGKFSIESPIYYLESKLEQVN